MHNIRSRQLGFTIVELLVVIVVIGVLAAVSLVSYTGLNQRAIVASIKSDLTSSSTQLKMYYTDNGTYPQSLDANYCPVSPTDARYCLKASPGTTYTYTSSSPYSTFTLKARNGTTVFMITDNTPPEEVAPLTAIADISGTAKAGSVLTAGALTPSGATATYQWQIATASGGPFSDISGATSSTYTPITNDEGKYLRVVATGTGSYDGSVTSASTLVVPPIFITGGTITESGGTRTHTLGTGAHNLTASTSGTVTIAIKGAGGGGAGGTGPGYHCNSPGGNGGSGSQSSATYNSSSYISYGGTGGLSNGTSGNNGATNSPASWTSVTGGGGAGGAGGAGAYDLDGPCTSGGPGGAGGRLTGTLGVASGQALSAAVGSGGAGGAAGSEAEASPGGAGANGSVVISYSY